MGRIAAALFALFVSLLGCAPAHAQGKLTIGSPAPKLEVKSFVKGQPVSGFAAGKIYVVEFWATWCGPCRATMPHLSSLQKKYPAVTFIGVSIWEEDQNAVKPFVAEMGNKVNYRLAMDSVPAGANGQQGKMARSWMSAAGETGIPTAFIVNGQGKIAWIGHPGQMDGPLAQIVKGTWNPAAAAAARKNASAREARMAALGNKMRAAKTPAAQLKVLDELLASEPSMLPQVGLPKLALMIQAKAPGVAAFTNKMAGVYQSNPEALNTLAWMLVDPARPKPAPDVARAALAAAQKADALMKGKESAIADTLARAYFVNGNVKQALATQERAVRLIKPGTPAAKDPTVKQRLAQYRKAAGK